MTAMHIRKASIMDTLHHAILRSRLTEMAGSDMCMRGHFGWQHMDATDCKKGKEESLCAE